jgi:hypothetical protein
LLDRRRRIEKKKEVVCSSIKGGDTKDLPGSGKDRPKRKKEPPEWKGNY